MRLRAEHHELREWSHATAHLIHGSTEGRFKVTYTPGHLSCEDILSVDYGYLDYQTALATYHPGRLKNGFN